MLQNLDTKLEIVTSVELPSYLSIIETLLIQLKPSNKRQVNEKCFFLLTESI